MYIHDDHIRATPVLVWSIGDILLVTNRHLLIRNFISLFKFTGKKTYNEGQLGMRQKKETNNKSFYL